MKTIKNSFGDISPAVAYNLMEGRPQKLSDYPDPFTCSAWILFEDRERLVLSLITSDGVMLATNSHTFIDGFTTYWELCSAKNVPSEQISVRALKNISKGGRTFISCEAC